MYRAGIDLGGTNIKAGIVDEQQHIIAEASVPTNVERPYQDIIRDMAELVKTLLKQKGIGETQLKSIGIGSPGTIDAVHGVVLYSNNFGWENVPLTEQLKKYFSCPIAVSNDANCAALGEVKAGAAQNTKNAILLTLGTGVGGGIILDGKVFEGAHAGGAELGHTSLICGGEPCTCGRKGCVEAYVSATALIRDAKRAAQQHPESILNTMCQGDLSHMNGKIPFDAAQDGDTAAEKVVNDYICYLGETITNFVNIFRPDIVLLSGGICNQGKKLTEPLETKNNIRPENIDKICNGFSKIANIIIYYFFCCCIPILCGIKRNFSIHVRKISLTHCIQDGFRVLLRGSFCIADQRCRRYICLHAAFPSACARLTATYQTCVSEFGTACMCALKHLSIENNSTAHTSSKSQQNRIFCILRRTGFYFTQSRTVCIIGNCNRTGKVLL